MDPYVRLKTKLRANMKIGGFGYIEQNGILRLPKKVTESLAIDDNCILFGLYYPPSDSYKKPDTSYINEHDFVFSSIPFDDWPFSARLTVRVVIQSYALEELTNILNQSNVTIMHSTSTRSGHRFSSIDFHIVFENLKNQKFQFEKFNKEKSYYEPALEALNDLKKEILDKDSPLLEYLFIDKGQIYLDNPISGKVNQALHYYFWKSRENLLKEKVDVKDIGFHISKPFSLRYSSGAFFEDMDKISTNSGGKLVSIISAANTINNINEPIIPSIVFVESDTNALHYRIRIIPRERAKYFLRIEITHTRLQGHQSTKGLLKLVMGNLIKIEEYKVWSYLTQVYECRDNYGAGKLTFFVELRNGKNYRNSIDKYFEVVEQNLDEETKRLNESLKKDKNLALSQILIHAPKLTPLRKLLSKETSKPWPLKKNYEFDVFLSYAGKDIEKVDEIENTLNESGVKAYKANDRVRTAMELSQEIFTNIRNSREFCLIYTRECENTDWILWELSAALALNKNVSFILVELKDRQVREEIKVLVKKQVYRSFNRKGDIEKYASELLSRRYLD